MRPLSAYHLPISRAKYHRYPSLRFTFYISKCLLYLRLLSQECFTGGGRRRATNSCSNASSDVRIRRRSSRRMVYAIIITDLCQKMLGEVG
ncbi:hypothetical protein Taro_009107 [Colocasia esculenta]|uniref:Uncharacterized protein n=1 Tax=Colocasia esculenta TaxID=4460 RepID=A0A843U5G5_COLES|nr:hypothetical protein [Colocasia esculenta]